MNIRLGRAVRASSFFLLAWSSACGLNMQSHYQKIRPKLLAHRYDEADAYLDKVKDSFYSKDNRLLYYMDKGTLLCMAKRYEESNVFLERAKTAAEELWTESIAKNAAAIITNDNALPYQGEDFEKVMLHFFAAFNYTGLQSYDNARVEARQITNDLELYNSKYESKNVYRDDAFARWFAGKLRETDTDAQALNDAWIDYRKSLAVYESDYAKRYHVNTPILLISDSLRVLNGLGSEFKDEFTALVSKYPNVAFVPQRERMVMGEVVLIHLSGEAPYKTDRYWSAVAGGDVIRIAYPEFVVKKTRIAGATIRAGTLTGATELTEDIAAIAVQNLQDHMARIKTKAIARQVGKYIAGKTAQVAGSRTKGNAGTAIALAGIAFNAASAISEEADKRSWITLASRVYVGRMFVPPGKTKLNVDFLGDGGNILEKAEFEADVRAGETTFLVYRTYQ